MSIDIGALNMQWSHAIVDQLIQHKITHFCLSPGSRSTPLALAIADHPEARHCVHFDERGTGYYALGIAKATGIPAVIITTTGTATANLFPALIEASHSKTPLILLTADRPHELRDCGADQTCDQTKIFGDYVRWYSDLSPPTPHLPERYIATTIAQAIHRATQYHPGPVHLNCPFREPLFTLSPPSFKSLPPTHYLPSTTTFAPENLEEWATFFQNTPRGLLVTGGLPPSQEVMPILELASLMQWPILPDILSQVRTVPPSYEVIRYYDALLKAQTDSQLKPDFILHIGDLLSSKTLSLWLKSLGELPYLHIANHPLRQDPHHLVTHRITGNPAHFFKSLLPLLEQRIRSHWIEAWKLPSETIAQNLEPHFSQLTLLTEAGIAHSLSNALSPHFALFLANSMPIRDANQFFFPKNPIGPIFCNRGVSGIDGNIATAIGVAQGVQKPTCAVLGDLSFLHDLNSLALLRQASEPVIFIVINNHGGALFSFLPIAQRKDILEEFFIASHPYHFQHAAELFQLPYFKPQNVKDWEILAQDLRDNPCSAIIEIETHRAENLRCHQEINQSVQKCLNGEALATPHFLH